MTDVFEQRREQVQAQIAENMQRRDQQIERIRQEAEAAIRQIIAAYQQTDALLRAHLESLDLVLGEGDPSPKNDATN